MGGCSNINKQITTPVVTPAHIIYMLESCFFFNYLFIAFSFFAYKSVTDTQDVWIAQQPGLHSCLNKPISNSGTEYV